MRLSFSRCACTATLLAALALPVLPAAAQTYHVYDLGTFGGASSNAMAINNNMQVVGWSSIFSFPLFGFIDHAFTHHGTGPLVESTDDLNTFGGLSSYAYGINSTGTVVGSAMDKSWNFEAFLHVGPVPLNPANVNRNTLVVHDDYGDLGDGSGETGDGYAVATGVNDSNTFVGYSPFGGSTYAYEHPAGYGTLYNRLLFMIAGEEGQNYAYGISNGGGTDNQGIVVGMSQHHGQPYHAMDVPNGAYTMWSDMGTMGGDNSCALAINDVSTTVGWSEVIHGINIRRAFRHMPTNVDNIPLMGVGTLSNATDALGTLGGWNSEAHAINNRNIVVGKADIDGTGATHAFVYGNSMVDLNSILDAASAAAWTLTEANGINDNDVIVGQGVINGQHHAFIAVPMIRAE
jgi:probable HAF family extracellular repeat protein